MRVYKRPGLDEFLDWVARHFEVQKFLLHNYDFKSSKNSKNKCNKIEYSH